MSFNNMKLSEITREYLSDVKSIAEDIAQEVEDSNEFHDAVHESVDGSQWVIYTYRAKLVGVVSDNADAADEYDMEAKTPEARAYWAMVADVNEFLSDEDFVTAARAKKAGGQ